MDANKIFETKQEAATTADLSQQEPHSEVVDVMPSIASSDEERLAAGISTTGLQTKRISGAQRKRLTRERKMREGTWMEKKPPRKTPSTQNKDGAGSSGGVKRSHSDSSTPSLEKHKTKNPGTFKCRLGRIRKLLLVSRWRLFIDAILTSKWIRLRST